MFGRGESRQGRRREAARWVMRELVALDERQSLEGLGLLRVRLDRDPSWPPPRPLLDLGLTGEECWLLLAELLRTLRLQGALTMPEEVDPADEMFDPRRGPSTSAVMATAGLLVLCYAVVARVQFEAGSGVAVPTQLVFIPMLFLAAPAAVPVLVALGLALSMFPEQLRGRHHPGRLGLHIVTASYAVGAVLVLWLARDPRAGLTPRPSHSS